MARAGLGSRWKCLFANDFDRVKAETYRANWGDDDFHQGDVHALTTADLPRPKHGGAVDLAWASSPCQDLSLAGKREGLSGARSSAFWGFWTLMKALNAEGRAPRTIVIENVTGLLTSHGGADFTALCQALANEGYRFGALEIDAARFLPQSRPRMFLIATASPPPNSITQVEPTRPFHSKKVQTAYDALPAALVKRWVWWRLKFPPANNNLLPTALNNSDGGWLPDDKQNHLVSLLSDTNRKKIEAAKARQTEEVGTVFRRMRSESGKKIQRAELRFDGFAGCIRTPKGGSSQQLLIFVGPKGVRFRPLSSREAANLMGLPPQFKLPEKRTAALSVIGDGLAVPVVDFLKSELLNALAMQEPDDDGN